MSAYFHVSTDLPPAPTGTIALVGDAPNAGLALVRTPGGMVNPGWQIWFTAGYVARSGECSPASEWTMVSDLGEMEYGTALRLFFDQARIDFAETAEEAEAALAEAEAVMAAEEADVRGFDPVAMGC